MESIEVKGDLDYHWQGLESKIHQLEREAEKINQYDKIMLETFGAEDLGEYYGQMFLAIQMYLNESVSDFNFEIKKTNGEPCPKHNFHKYDIKIVEDITRIKLIDHLANYRKHYPEWRHVNCWEKKFKTGLNKYTYNTLNRCNLFTGDYLHDENQVLIKGMNIVTKGAKGRKKAPMLLNIVKSWRKETYDSLYN